MKEKQSQTMSEGTVWISNPKQLAHDYATGWFLMDFLSVAVVAVDFYSLTQSNDSNSGNSLLLLKLLRVLRLFKLVRLVRSSRITKRWETRIALDYSLISMVKCAVLTIIVCHWMACIWLLQAFLGVP